MTEVALSTPHDPPADLVSLSPPELRAELVRSIRMTVESLIRMSWIVRLLEEKGEDLSDIRLSILGYLRKIAYGQVSPEAVVRFAERPTILQKIASLPMPDQIKLASGSPVKVLIRSPDGSMDHRMLDPTILSRNQVAQVFGPGGRLRDEAEQSCYLDDRRATTTKYGTPSIPAKIRVDAERGGIRVGKTFVATADLLEALASMSAGFDDDEEPDNDSLISIKLTSKQKISAGIAAKRGGVSLSTLVRRAMATCGLFGQE